MAKTVVGLFDSFAEAQDVVQELVNNGLSRDTISLIANNARGEYATGLGAHEVGTSGAVEGAGAGAVGGGVLGGVLGLLVGLGALAIPGIGPVIAAGPLAAALGTAGASAVVGAGIGAVSGGLLGALVGAGIPEADANYYAEGVRRGGTLVMATTDDAMANTTYSIMQRRGAVDIRTRGDEWRQSGWERFDPNAGPYAADDLRTRGGTTNVTGDPSQWGARSGTTDVAGDPSQWGARSGTTGVTGERDYTGAERRARDPIDDDLRTSGGASSVAGETSAADTERRLRDATYTAGTEDDLTEDNEDNITRSGR